MGLEEFRETSQPYKDKNHHRQGVSPANKISDEELLDCLIRFVNEKEEKLTYVNFNQADNYPSSRTIENRFGTWNEALKKAGVETNKETTRLNVTEDMYDMSSSKAYIIGVLMGDGSINKVNSFILNTVDKDFAEEFGKQFCEWAELTWKGFESDETEVSCYLNKLEKKEHNTQYIVKKGVTDISEHLRQYKYPNSHEKVLKEVEGFEKEMIRGLWDSEGWVEKRGRVGFVNGHLQTTDLYCSLLERVFNMDSFSYNRRYREDLDVSEVLIPNRHSDYFLNTVEPTITRKINKNK